MPAQTPRQVMFEDLKKYCGLKYRDAGWLLLSTRPVAGGASPRESLDLYDRSTVKRKYVDVAPEQTNPSHFGDIASGSLTAMAHAVARQGGGEAGRARVAAHYRGPAVEAMAAALDDWGLSGTAYRNAVSRIDTAALPASKDRASLYLMLFVACGCLQDPGRAARLVGDFMEKKLGGRFGATTLRLDGEDEGDGSAAPVDPAAKKDAAPAKALGLLRMEGTSVRLPGHELYEGPGGTVIGFMPGGAHTVSVDDDEVSAEHLRVFLEDGNWYAEGLGSTNGTVLVSGANGAETPVEPPRSEREPGRAYPPVRIDVGDVLRLGSRTAFLVVLGAK